MKFDVKPSTNGNPVGKMELVGANFDELYAAFGDGTNLAAVTAFARTLLEASTAQAARSVLGADSLSGALAAAGSTQGTATPLTSQDSIVTTATAGSAEGIQAPAIASATYGSYKAVNKVSGVVVLLYPATGESWGAGYSANQPVAIFPDGYAVFFKSGASWILLLHNPSVQSEYSASATAKEFELVNGSILYLSLSAGLSLAMPVALYRPSDVACAFVSRTGTNTIKPPSGGIFDMDGTLLDADDRISLAAGKMAAISYRSATGTYVVTSDGATDAGPA